MVAAPTATQSPGIGLPQERDFSGPWLSQQILLTASLGLISFASFSLLVKRKTWRGYLAPITRRGGDSSVDPLGTEDDRLNRGDHTRLGRFLSRIGLEWAAVTWFTSDVAVAHLSGPPTSSIDSLSLLNFFRFGAHLFATLSVWSVLILMPVNWRENGWLDGVRPAEDGRGGKDHKGDKHKGNKAALLSLVLQSWIEGYSVPDDRRETKPLPPDTPIVPSIEATTLYDATHLLTTYAFSIAFLYLLTKRTSAFVAHHQKILHTMHASLPARSILIRSLPASLQSSAGLRDYFEGTLDMPTKDAWVLPDVGMGVRKLLTQRETALRELERAWVSWVGNPVRKEMREEWQPRLIEERIQKRSQRVLAGEERLPNRGFLARASPSASSAPHASQAHTPYASSTPTTPLLDSVPPYDTDPAYGPPSFVGDRPSQRLQLFSSQRVDLLSDLEVKFLKLDVAIGLIRQKMLEGQWKSVNVGFVEFESVREALVASQTVFYEREGHCRTSLAPDNRDIIWRNIGIPVGERRMRQLLVCIALTLLYLFYLPPLFFLGSLLSPGFLNKYIPGFYKILSVSPRLEALVSTSLPSLVLVAFNAGLPMLLEATAVWQGVKTKSGVELSVLKKYHIFLITSVVFVFFITTTAFGVLLDLSSNPMAILDKLSTSLPKARNFSLSYVILQSLTILPLQLLSLPIVLMSPLYVLTAKTPREHAEAHGTPLFKAGTIYPQALIIATLGMLYSIVKPLVTLFATLYFCIGYIVFKYKLLFVFYPPPSSSTGQSIMGGVLRPRLIFAAFLFQLFQLSLFSVHGEVILVILMLPLIVGTLWYGHFLKKRFAKLELYETLEGALSADKANGKRGFRDSEAPTPESDVGSLTYQADSNKPPASVSQSYDWSSADHATSEWSQSRPGRGRGDGTGTSTPSEVATNEAETPPLAVTDTSQSNSQPSKRIWSPMARLKRGFTGRRSKITGSAAADAAAASRRAIPTLVYHRPASKFTNYREPSALVEGGGFDSLPGLVERRSRLSFSTRSGTQHRASLAGDVETGDATSALDDDDEEQTEDEDEAGNANDGTEHEEVEEDGIETAETYEHPAIEGRLKQLWLPSASRRQRQR